MAVTGGWETFADVTRDADRRAGRHHELYLVFTGGAGSLFDIDDFTFTTGAPAAARSLGIGRQVRRRRTAPSIADGTKIQLWTCNNTAA